MNALQAAAAVWSLAQRPFAKVDLRTRALDMSSLAETLAHTTLPPGRLQCLTSPTDPFTVYVDYAHTDDALRTVLSVLRAVMTPGAGRLSLVFGCGGDRDTTKRPRMGAAAAELADRVYVTSDNPRTEDPRSIIDAIVAGMPTTAWPRTVIEPDRAAAIHQAIADAGDRDIIIIAGKGHEDYQIVPDPDEPLIGGAHARRTVKRFFDDRLVARDALAKRGVRARLAPASPVIRHPAGANHRTAAHTPRTTSP
jgi:UDP-N-acetylmuramyl tripeptide synthase